MDSVSRVSDSNLDNPQVHTSAEDNLQTSEASSTNSLLNPLTPNSIKIYKPPVSLNQTMEAPNTATNFSEERWKPREQISGDGTESTVYNIPETKLCSEDSVICEDSSYGFLAEEVSRNLQIKSRRGRPKTKHSSGKENKAFKVPRRRKKGCKMGLPIISGSMEAPRDEAEMIFETGVLMGLLPLGSKESSVELIKKHLHL